MPYSDHKGIPTVLPRETCTCSSPAPGTVLQKLPTATQNMPHYGPQESADRRIWRKSMCPARPQDQTENVLHEGPRVPLCHQHWGCTVNCMPEESGSSQRVTHQRNCACTPTTPSICSGQLRGHIHGRRIYNSKQRQ